MPDREDTLGPYEHARKLVEELRKELERKLDVLRDYTDKRNSHRRAAIEMVEETVIRHEAELMRGEEKPGWVHSRLKSLEAGQSATAETLKWQNRLLFGTLLGLLANLAAPLWKGG